MASETGEYLGVFTDSDRRMLREVHAMLKEVEPFLVHLPALAALADNPAIRWSVRHGRRDRDTDGPGA